MASGRVESHLDGFVNCFGCICSDMLLCFVDIYTMILCVISIVISITVLMASGFPNKQQILASKHYVGVLIEGEEIVSGQDVRGQNSCTITNVHAFSN